MHTLLLTLLLLFIGADPLDRPYSEQTVTADLQAILLTDSPDSAAYKGITQYLLLMSFAEEKLEGKTYREILDLYQLWDMQDKSRQAREEVQAALEAEAERKRTEELAKVVDVRLLDITTQYTDSTVQFRYSISISNASDRKVKSLSGFLYHQTATGGSLLSVDVTFQEPLLPRSTRTKTITTTYAYNPHADHTPGWTEADKAKVVWKPEEVKFEVGPVGR